MAKDYSAIAKDIVRLIGGEGNVSHFDHCSTRLRITVVDASEVDKNALQSTTGVMGVVLSGNQCQVVIGNDVLEVFDEINKQYTFTGEASEAPAGGKRNIGATVLDFLVGVFQPLVPAIAGGGILKAFLSLFALIGIMDNTSTLYSVLINVADAPLYFLPLLVAVSMATKIKCNRLVALATVGALILPKTTALLGGDAPAVLFGLPLQNVTYAYQVFPAILSVALLYFVEKGVTKITPKPIRVFFVPMVCFVVVFPLTLLFLGPIGLFIGNGMTTVMLGLYQYVGWLAVGLVAAFLPLLISIGAHKAFIPYVVSSLGDLGYEILYNGASLAHNISEGGASLAVAVRTKNPELRSTALSTAISAIFGITEPAIYSVTLQHKRVLYGVMIGSFISGSFIGYMGVKAFVAMGPGLAGMAMFVDPENAMNIVWAFAGFGIALVASFAATCVLYKDEVVEEAKAPEAEGDCALTSHMTGKLIDVTEVNDPVFSSKVMGDGMAVIPEVGELYAPADGTVVMVADSKHAIGMECADGEEILMHVGMDTVKLNGEFFDPQVRAGQQVKKGDLLMKFELEKIKYAGFDPVTPMVVLNTDQFVINKGTDGAVRSGDTIITLAK